MSKKRKRIRYEPIREEDTLGLGSSICQAASLLDEMAEKAIINRDDKLMLKIADRWIMIANMFSAGDESPDEHVDTNDNVEQYGFGPLELERDAVKEDDDESDGTTEGDSKTRGKAKPRQLQRGEISLRRRR